MHANIVRVFEYHDDPDGPYFGLQYIGENNIGVTAGGGLADSLRPLAMIADALRYAHGKDIVHRDIKAANVLLDSRGVPYLVDFGVAAAVGSDEMGTSGSAIAQSPAQAKGASAATADDIFAFGVLMHELLFGRPPVAPGPIDTAATQRDGSPIPQAIRSLLSDMLGAEPRSRPDAESVGRRLHDAGFAPGPAPSKYVGSDVSPAEVLERVDVGTSRRRGLGSEPLRQASKDDSAGIPPGLLYGGLGVAATLLIAVIFVLPLLVEPEQERPGVEPEVPAQSPTLQEDDEVEDPQSEPASARTSVPSDTSFSENLADQASIKAQTDIALGDLLSQLERLRYRAIERWGGQPYLDAVNVYAEGDQAYVDKNYRLAGEKYRTASRMLDPFFDRIDQVFDETLAAAKVAFEAHDPSEAVRLFDLAVSITPGNREAEAGLSRARNLETVLSLVDQGERFEKNLEYDAAKQAFESALGLDGAWEPASAGLDRVRASILDLTFESRSMMRNSGRLPWSFTRTF
jgi:tetratricopeptide (TPR) repeat protein